MFPETAESMTWHDKCLVKDGNLRRPALIHRKLLIMLIQISEGKLVT